MTAGARPALARLPIRILDLELAAAAPTVQPSADMSMAEVLIRLHGLPVGVVRMHGGTPSPEAVRRHVADHMVEPLLSRVASWRLNRTDLRNPVESAFDVVPTRPEPARDVTVVICTRDRPVDLDDALSALAQCRPAAVVVVDNSAEGSAAGIAERHPGVRRIHEPRPGLDIARNRGLAEVETPLVAFTDDDVHVDPGWAYVISRFFARNPDASALTGLVLPLELSTESQWRFEDYLGFARGFERTWHFAPGPGPIASAHGNTGRLGTGANMAFRTSALRAVDAFDPALDAGTATGGGGDLEAFFRILKGGGLLGYEPAAVVRHRHRRTGEGLRSQIRSWGTGMGAYLESVARAFPDESRSTAALRRRLLLTWFMRRWLSALFRRRHRLELVTAEIAGLFEGSRLYAEAARSDSTESRRFSRIDGGTTGKRTLDAGIDLKRPLSPLLGLADARAVRIDVRDNGARVGTVVMDVVNGTVGTDRLADELVRAFPTALLGESPRSARRRVRRRLAVGPQ